MRDRFDETRKEQDMRKLAAMVEEGEEELWRNQHFQPFYFKVCYIPIIVIRQVQYLLNVYSNLGKISNAINFI